MIASALVLLAVSAANGPLAELDAALARLPAREPIRATFALRFDAVNGEGKDAARQRGEVGGAVSEGPGGLVVSWPRALVAQARDEDRRRATDPAAEAPARDGLAAVSALQLAGYLDAAAGLRQELAGAAVLEDRQDAMDGVPARLLVLRLEPQLSARDRRYVKEVEVTGRLWLGPDGLPLAAETHARISGRAFLVVSFSSEQRERYRFEREGDRLVTVRHESSRRGEGAGERNERTSAFTLAVVRPNGAAAGGD